jgi:hypothetical protein
MEIGASMSRATIAKIESGGTRARNVSLEDVLVLAAALDTSPAVLFLPIGFEDSVWITPSLGVHPHHAMQWIEGVEPLSNRNIPVWRKSVEPLRLHRGLRALQSRVASTRSHLQTAQYVGDSDRIKQARSKYAEALEEIAEYMQEMEQRGVRPVELHEDVRTDMKAIGLRP